MGRKVIQVGFDRNELVEAFFSMIRDLNGTPADSLLIRDFFGLLSEIKVFVPPTVEFMAVLKTYRPILFYKFRKSLIPRTSMWYLSHVNIDVGQALLNLEITSEEQLYRLVKGTRAI
jgi:hypothetical protein